jgi:hypothetical protein
MSGLIASTRRMTISGSYVTPSNVQFVSSSIRAWSSRPAAFNSSSRFSISAIGTAPYIEYCWSGYESR